MAPTPKKWQIQHDGKLHGPYADREIAAWIDAGKIPVDAMLKREGKTEWETLAEVQAKLAKSRLKATGQAMPAVAPRAEVSAATPPPVGPVADADESADGFMAVIQKVPKGVLFGVGGGAVLLLVLGLGILIGRRGNAEIKQPSGLTQDAKQSSKNSDKQTSSEDDATTMLKRGDAYASGTGVQKDEAEAVKGFRKAAELGNAQAQYNLGVCYAYGGGTLKNEVEAVRWYHKAAEQGDVNAQLKLGECYANGTGISKDEVKAVKWYSKAAEQGNADAQFWLGICYLSGTGIPKDETEGAKWFRKAAEQGDVAAQLGLGKCYYSGMGIPKDKAEAVKWFRKAAEQGNADAQGELGACYYSGMGIPKDEAEGVKWLRKAAEQGNADAQQALKQRGY